MRQFLLIALCFITSTAWAYDVKFPKGCEPSDFSFKDNELYLNQTEEDKQHIFFIHNKSSKKLNLIQVNRQNSLVIPGWKAKISPNRWAAFAMDRPETSFQCVIGKGKKAKATDCAELVNVCHYPRAKFSLSNRGNYWVTRNKTRNSAVRTAIRKGIHLRW